MSGPGSGWLAGSRAIFRWAWRLFRRDWRQQVRVLLLLSVAIMATVVCASAAYNLAPVRGNAEFGTATRFIRFDVPDSQSRDAVLAAAESQLGSIDAFSSRAVAVPGTVDSVEFRAQDPEGPFSGPMLALLEGRYPTAQGEVAVTNRVVETFALDVDSTLTLAGETWMVVGIVENPSDLSDEFALETASTGRYPQTFTILTNAGRERVESLSSIAGNDVAVTIGTRPVQEAGFAVVIVLIVAAIALLLVSLVAAAGFVAIAQRRLRQLGMLAAIGATEGHLRLVMVANGIVLGALAALFGSATGALAWVVAAPRLELVVGHRIDRFNVPWWLLAATVVLALVTATAAAWWPARTVARVPVVRALSGRPPASQPVQRSSALAGLLVPVGVALLAWADPSKVVEETSDAPIADPFHALLIIVGTLAVAVGMLLAGPLAIRALAATARWLPVAMRLALRDLVRFQARSAAALAATSLALGIASAIVVAAAATEPTSDEGNLSERQLLIWTRDPGQPAGISPFYTEDPNDSGFSPFLPRLSEEELDGMESTAGEIAALFDGASLIGLEVAMDPAVEPEEPGQPAITLARDVDNGLLDIALVYAATPALLAHYAVELDAVGGETEILTSESGGLWFPGLFDPTTGRNASEQVRNLERIERGYTSLPGSFVTPAAMESRGWEAVRVGWLVESRKPLTSEQMAQARSLAVDADVLIETRDDDGDLQAVGWPATATGVLVALSVLAMTVGLIRGEAAGDLRTLVAAGASVSIRRTLTAFTAGALALLGALLGGAGAYLILAALYAGEFVELSQLPVLQLLVIALGVPLAAAAAGWLLSGGEPPGIARQVIE